MPVIQIARINPDLQTMRIRQLWSVAALGDIYFNFRGSPLEFQNTLISNLSFSMLLPLQDSAVSKIPGDLGTEWIFKILINGPDPLTPGHPVLIMFPPRIVQPASYLTPYLFDYRVVVLADDFVPDQQLEYLLKRVLTIFTN